MRLESEDSIWSSTTAAALAGDIPSHHIATIIPIKYNILHIKQQNNIILVPWVGANPWLMVIIFESQSPDFNQ